MIGHKTRSVFQRYHITSEGDLYRAADQLEARHHGDRGALIAVFGALLGEVGVQGMRGRAARRRSQRGGGGVTRKAQERPHAPRSSGCATGAVAMTNTGWRRMAQVSDRQRRAIEALLISKSASEAAEASGISRRTLERWKRDPAFQDAYRAASREKLGETVGRLRVAASEAVGALQEALHADAPAVRVRAAQVLLDGAIKVEVDDLARRVEALEAAQKGPLR